MMDEEMEQQTNGVKEALSKLGYDLDEFPSFREGVTCLTARPREEYGTRPDGSVFRYACFGNAYAEIGLRSHCLLGILLAVLNTGGDLSR